ELTDSRAGQADSRDARMPAQVERSDRRPYLAGVRVEGDRFGNRLQLWFRAPQKREHRHARLRCTGGAALQELAIVIDEPGEQDVNHVRIDRAASARLVRMPANRALLNLEMPVGAD